MTFRTLTLASPVLLEHIKISFREYKPLKNISKPYFSFFMSTLRKLKTTYAMRNLHLYVPNKGTYLTSQLYKRMRKYFNTIGKNYYWCGNKHGRYRFGEWRFFWWRFYKLWLCFFYFNLVPVFPSLIPIIPINPFIPFPDSQFRLLQIAFQIYTFNLGKKVS